MKINYLTIIGLTITSLYVIICIFTMHLQFASSNQFTKKFQQLGGEGVYQVIFIIITYLGFPVIPCLPLIPLLVLKDKWVPFKISVLFATACYINGLLKIIYGGPRPWWAEPNIKVFSQCNVTDYGRPSGHAFISLYSFLVLFQYYIYEDNSKTFAERVLTHEIEIEDYNHDDRDSQESTPDLEKHIAKKLQKISTLQKPQVSEWGLKKSLWLATGILTCVLIGLSRIYLGAHSYEQILLGWSFAILAYIITAHFLDERIDKLLLYFLDGRHRSHNLKILLIATTAYVLALILPIAVLAATESFRAADKKLWLENMLRQCKLSTESHPIDSVSLYLCVSITVPFAVVIGLMFAKTNIMITPNNLGITKLILRKLVAAIVLVLIAGSFLSFLPKNYIIIYLVNFNLCLFFMVIAGYLLLPRVFVLLKLSEGSILRIRRKA